MLMQTTLALHRSTFQHILSFFLITNLAPHVFTKCKNKYTILFPVGFFTVFVIFYFLWDVLGHLTFAVKYGYIKALSKIFRNLYDALQRLSSNWIIYAEVKLFRLQMGSKISAHYLFWKGSQSTYGYRPCTKGPYWRGWFTGLRKSNIIFQLNWIQGFVKTSETLSKLKMRL